MTTDLYKYLNKPEDELKILLTADISRDDIASIHTAIGCIEYFKNKPDKATEAFNKALAIYTELGNKIKIAFCNAYNALFSYMKNNSNIEEAERILLSALNAIQTEKSDEANDVKAVILLCNGIINYNEKNFSKALSFYKKALNMTLVDSLVSAKILDNMGLFYLRSSNFHIAMTYLKESLEIKKHYEIKSELAITKMLLGRYYISIENYNSALIELQETLDIVKAYNDIVFTSRIMDEIAKTYVNMGDYEKAEEILNQAFEYTEEIKNHPTYIYLNCTYISLLTRQDKTEEAVRLLEEKVISAFENPDNPRTNAIVKHLKAEILIKQHRYEDAVLNLYEAIDCYKSIKLFFEEAKSYFELAKVHKLMNNPQMVVSSLLEALRVTSDNEFPLLNKKIEDFLYEIDSQEWANVVDKTARKEKLFSESQVILDTLDLISKYNEQAKPKQQTKDPLFALQRFVRFTQAHTDIGMLIEVIAKETKVALSADRCTIFLYDENTNELWSRVALGMNSTTIRIPADKGVVGHVIMTGETLNIQNAYESEYFTPEVDLSTGYHTQSVLCMPIKNLENKIIGAFEVLNKDGEDYFSNEDENILNTICSYASIALENANLFAKQVQMIEEQQKSFTSFINTLATSIDARDKITAGHSLRVTKYTSIIAREMKFSEEKIDAFEKAALLHDIGKIGVHDNVLFKEGRLTDEEYKHIQKHAEITSDILKQMYFTENLKDVPEIAASHHERFDGKGYFKHRAGENIHIGGRILAVSDVFDAITSKRHYRDRMEISNVLKIIHEGSGSHFDPEVVNIFFKVSVDKILNILITAYDRTLNEEEVKYFSGFSIGDLYAASSKLPEERTPDEAEFVIGFNKLYLNEN